MKQRNIIKPKSLVEIREKLNELYNQEGIAKLSDKSNRNGFSLSKIRFSINALRWCLGEVCYIFPIVKNHYRFGSRKPLSKRLKRI